MSISENLSRVWDQIAQAARQAGREPETVKLVAVSKTFTAEHVFEAYQAGVRDFGENRVEEASTKIPQVETLIGSRQVSWHLIGHLQRRKAREAIQLFTMIQSVDTVRLAVTLDQRARERGVVVPILLEANVSGDPHKFGFQVEPREQLNAAVQEIVNLPSLRVQGLMTIGPIVASAEQARPFFRGLRELRDELAARYPQGSWTELSMGMTDDFRVAVEEGATIVRIGRAIFGERPGKL